MEFNFRGWDAQMEHMYHTEGLWSQGGSVDTREAIQRELEKERIREEIVAEEIARRRLLEAEVRREMATHDPSSFMLKPPLSHNNRLEPGMPRAQPFAPVSLEEKHGGGSGRQHREIGAFQRFPLSTGDGKNKVIDLGKPNGVSLFGAKGKSATAGSSMWSCAVCKVSVTCEHDLNQHLVGKKHQAQMTILKANKAQTHGAQQKTCKKQSFSSSISAGGMIKLNNRSAEIGLGVASKKSTIMESNLLKSNNKSAKMNSSKCTVSIDSSKKEDNKKSGTRQQFMFSCEICNVGATSDKAMNDHIKGKKHLKNLLKLHQESAAPATKKKLETVGGLEKVIGDQDKESTENTHCCTVKVSDIYRVDMTETTIIWYSKLAIYMNPLFVNLVWVFIWGCFWFPDIKR